MAKRKAEYIEGRKARKNFEDAMRHAFSIPKEPAPKGRPTPEGETSKMLREESRELIEKSREIMERCIKGSKKSGSDKG